MNYPAVAGRLDLGNFNKEIGPDILGSMIMRDEMDKTEYGVKSGTRLIGNNSVRGTKVPQWLWLFCPLASGEQVPSLLELSSRTGSREGAAPL